MSQHVCPVGSTTNTELVYAGQGLPHEGNYSSWLEAKAKRMEVGIQSVLLLNWTKGKGENDYTPLGFECQPRGATSAPGRHCWVLLCIRRIGASLCGKPQSAAALCIRRSTKSGCLYSGLAGVAVEVACHSCQKRPMSFCTLWMVL